MFALSMGIVCAANAQEVKNDGNGETVPLVTEKVTASDIPTLQKDIYPQQEEDLSLIHI